jgi:hypothetical protein
MFYFKFVYNFVYFIILFINIKLDNNKDLIFLDSYYNLDRLYLDNNIDNDYNNIICYKEVLNILDYFNL